MASLLNAKVITRNAIYIIYPIRSNLILSDYDIVANFSINNAVGHQSHVPRTGQKSNSVRDNSELERESTIYILLHI